MLVNSALFTINQKTNELNELCRRREDKMLSNRELYRKFEISRRWCQFKVNLVKEIKTRRSIPNNTTIDDVPQALLLEPGIPDELL